MKKKQIAITLGIMCLLLTFGIGIQLKTTKNLVSTAGSTYRENGLRDEVLKWKEQYDRIYETLENAEQQLEKERQVSILDDDTSVEKQEELKKLNTYLGLTDVRGEAISINGQRIVPSTSITCAGTVIQVNNEIVGSPFVIKVIGNQDMINNIIRSGGYAYTLKKDYGINVDVKKSDDIKIEKYNGVLTQKYIKTVE